MPRKFTPFIAAILSLLACATPGATIEPTVIPDDGVQTIVAATLTASAPHDLPTATPPPPTEPLPATAAPTDTPAPVPPTPTLPPPTATCLLALADGPTVLCHDGLNGIQIGDAGSGNSVYRVAVSPDGGLVAFIASRPDTVSELWVVNSDGTNPRKLAGPEQLVGSDPTVTNWPRTAQWQAGTHNLFFDTGFTPAGGPFGPGEYINSDLWVVNADTGSLSQMLTPGTAGVFSLSPDGAWVAVSQPDSIDVIGADGATVRPDLIRFEPIITYSEYAYKPLVTWGADSTYFIVSIPSHDPLAADAGATLYAVGVDGATQTMTTITGTFLFDAFVKPSPDGQWVAYLRITFDGTTNHTFLQVARTDGTAESGGEVPNGAQLHGWSPDSAWVAYSIPDSGLYVSNTIAVGQPLAEGVQAVKDVIWTNATTVLFTGAVNDHWGLRQTTVGGGLSDVAGPFTNGMVFDVRQ
jgi:hypothetical protein